MQPTIQSTVPRGRLVASDKPLRVIACGSVDDGKSTFLGRLLFDTGSVLDDQLQRLSEDSQKYGRRTGAMDVSLLLDGLEAERERAITIDVAYRQFMWEGRRYLVADCPGHVEYTGNMAGGASRADVCLILVDARVGVTKQTLVHLRVAVMLGVTNIVAAINKMDLVSHDEGRYLQVCDAIRQAVRALGLEDAKTVPVIAISGDNIVMRSRRMDWYAGPTVMELLCASPVMDCELLDSVRLAVQWVNVPGDGFRGYAGPLLGGPLYVGQDVTILPSRRRSKIAEIFSSAGASSVCAYGDQVTVTLFDPLDVSRGDVIVASGEEPSVAASVSVDLMWLSEHAYQSGRRYLMKVGYGVADVLSIDCLPGEGEGAWTEFYGTTLSENAIASCVISLSSSLVLDTYQNSRLLGGLIIIDADSCETVAFGVVRGVMPDVVDFRLPGRKEFQASVQPGRVVWLTGISGAGKSTLAEALRRRLADQGLLSAHLDGDEVRAGLSSDLSFSAEDRSENVRRVSHVAKLMMQAGLTVIVSLISPSAKDRASARRCIGSENYSEVYVDVPLHVAEARDAKGLYRRARGGEILGFTGIDSPYEAPVEPEAHVRTDLLTIDEAVSHLVSKLSLLGTFPAHGKDSASG